MPEDFSFVGKSKTPGCLGSRAFLLTFGGAVFRTIYEKAPRRGDDGIHISHCEEMTYGKSEKAGDVKSDVLTEVPVLMLSEGGIVADLAMVINAWGHISAGVKKNILAIVRQEHMSSEVR